MTTDDPRSLKETYDPFAWRERWQQLRDLRFFARGIFFGLFENPTSGKAVITIIFNIGPFKVFTAMRPAQAFTFAESLRRLAEDGEEIESGGAATTPPDLPLGGAS